tara:strand:+ start:7280 stop:8257 length:978 start_codon:yes stop_codon:yes gene_type:complete
MTSISTNQTNIDMLRFKPLYKERVWGGQNLASRLGRQLPLGKCIGESWEIVDRESEQSIVAEGPLKGNSLEWLLKFHSEAIMGPQFPKGSPFPILVKWLDCKETLSVQVHPPQNIASELGGEPKSENWFILDCEPNAKLYLGLKSGATLESFKSALDEDRLEDLLNEVPTKAGDSYYIESGKLHAIGAGHLILEIQQNSDTTYRVYDWKRKGLDGEPRKLHLEESIKSLTINDSEPEPKRIESEVNTLADTPYFRIRGFDLPERSTPLCLPKESSPHLIHLIEGEIYEKHSGQSLSLGETALVPYSANAEFIANMPSKVLITDRF